ncbi:MAG: hypothetical protein J0H75_15515, partial [Rhizobiales bacterium]|nr:hypothetical protein [Hyphomicrobiales bacterium]
TLGSLGPRLRGDDFEVVSSDERRFEPDSEGVDDRNVALLRLIRGRGALYQNPPALFERTSQDFGDDDD